MNRVSRRAAAEPDGQVRDDRRRLVLSLPALPAEVGTLARVRRAVAEFVDVVALTPTRAQDVVLATYEAVANTVEHAYTAEGDATFDLCAEHDADTNTVTVTITDHGRWKNADPDPSARRGRGLVLMRSCADIVDITTGAAGTRVLLQWNTASRGPLPDDPMK